MTHQEIFDKAARGLLAQNHKSAYCDNMFYNSCRYNGPWGMHCAAAHVAPGPWMENAAIDDKGHRELLKAALEFKSDFDERQKIALVRDLQDIHDQWEPAVWPKMLTDLANKRGLSPACILEFTDVFGVRNRMLSWQPRTCEFEAIIPNTELYFCITGEDCFAAVPNVGECFLGLYSEEGDYASVIKKFPTKHAAMKQAQLDSGRIRMMITATKQSVAPQATSELKSEMVQVAVIETWHTWPSKAWGWHGG